MEVFAALRQGLLRALLAIAAIGALAGCSGSNCNPVAPIEPTLVSLSIGPPYARLPAGYSQQYVVSAIYSDGSKRQLSASQVVWSSRNAAVASISTKVSGTANSLSQGETTITATLDGISTSSTLNVTAAVLVSIELTPAGASVPAGIAKPYQATGIYSDGSHHDVTAAVTWNSSVSGIAAVSNAAGSNGLVNTLATGSTVVSATLNGISASTALTVTAPVLVSIAVTPSASSLPKGLTQQYIAAGTFSDGTHEDLTTSVAWTSSAPSAASIAPGGLASANSLGSTTITATLGNVSGSTPLSVTAATLVSIGVTPSAASVAKGLQPQMTAVGVFSDGTTQVITSPAVWTSSNATVAEINNAGVYSGLATALAIGTTTLTATYQGVSGSTALTVTAATLQSIEVTPSHPSIANATAEGFTATGIYTDGTTQNLTQTATWNSSAPTVATVSNAAGTQGVATSVSVGSTTITATQGGISGSTPLNVAPAPLISIAVTPATASIPNGTAEAFVATGNYADNSTQILTTAATWSSSATGVATVSNATGSNGLASSKGIGNSTITASYQGVSGTASLAVTAAVLQSIVVTPSNRSIANGTNEPFIATGTYTDGTTRDLTTTATWTSSSPSIATISNSVGSVGIAHGVALGSTTITATHNGISGATGLNVTAAVLVSIAITPASPTVFVGVTQPFIATGTYSDGSTQDLTASPSLVWASSATSVATENNAAPTQGQLTPLTAGTTTVSATVGSISGSAIVTVALREYAYVANRTDGTISPYLVGNSGALTPLGSGTVSSGGTSPFSIAVDNTRGNLYVTNIDGGSSPLTQFSIGANGILTQTATYTTNFYNAAYLTFDRTRSYLYVANLFTPTHGSVNEYQIASDGTLTYLGSVTQGFTTPFHLVVDPSNRWLYVLSAGTGEIAQLSLNASTGALTYLSSITIPGGGANAFVPELIVISGSHAFVSAQYNGSTTTTNGEVMEYSIDQTTGALTLVNTVTAGVYARSILLDPTGTYVYVANVYGGSISEYSVTANGLQPLATLPTGAGSQPSALNTDPTGRYVYASLQGTNQIFEYSINSDGTLNFLSSTTTGVGPDWVATGN